MFKRLLTSLLLACFLLTSTTGCIGRMATNGLVMKFNLSVTENKWGRAGVFLILMIIPVYSIASLIDLIVMNSIEFHTGTNPISGQDRLARAGETKYVRGEDGSEAIATLLEDGSVDFEIRAADGSVHRVNLIQEEGQMVARDVDGNRVAAADARTGEVRTLAPEVEL